MYCKRNEVIKRLIYTLFILSVILTLSAVKDHDSIFVHGTDNNGIHYIKSVEDFQNLGGHALKGNYELTCDVDLTGKSMKQIKSLEGSFEGNGFEIKGYRQEVQGESGINAEIVYGGLFKSVKGKISNLVLENVKITAEKGSNIYLGGLAGHASGDIKLQRCSISGEISQGSAGTYAGGFLGKTGENKIEVNSCNVYGMNINGDKSKCYIGGLIGYVNQSDITLDGTCMRADLRGKYVSGIVGYMYKARGEIRDTLVSGKVSSGDRYVVSRNGTTSPSYNVNFDIEECYHDNFGSKISSYTITSDFSGSNKGVGEFKALNSEDFKDLPNKENSRFGVGKTSYPQPKWMIQEKTLKILRISSEDFKSITLKKGEKKTELVKKGEYFIGALESGEYEYKAVYTDETKVFAEGKIFIGKTDKDMELSSVADPEEEEEEPEKPEENYDVTEEPSNFEGEGSEKSPYIIKDKNALRYIVHMVNMGNKNFSSAHIKLANDIDLENQSWTPLGINTVYPFQGVFDGNNKTITGLNVVKARSYYGLFGVLKNAEVKNLTVRGQVYSSEPYAMAGGIAGKAIGDVKIIKCAGLVNVSALARGSEGVGGLIGSYEDGVDYKWENHSLDIDRSYNGGNVICTGKDLKTTIGGLVGGNKNCIRVTDSYNAGYIYGPGVTAGGILGNAGYRTGDDCSPGIKYSYNSGKVVGAEDHEFNFYGKGIITKDNMVNSFSEDTATGKNNYGITVTDENRKDLVSKLGEKWMASKEKNGGKPYLKDNDPQVNDPALLKELEKYSKVIPVPSGSKVGYKAKMSLDGVTVDPSITVTPSQSKDDIKKGYIKVNGEGIFLKKINSGNKAITETASLLFEKNRERIFIPVEIIIYPDIRNNGELIDRIAKSYIKKSDEWIVFDMEIYSRPKHKKYNTEKVTKENYVNLAINDLENKNSSANDRAKGEIILGSLGFDTQTLKAYGKNKTYNNGKLLKEMSMHGDYYTIPWILLADQRGKVKLSKEQVQNFVNELAKRQGANGICRMKYLGKTYDDIDTTAVAISAFVKYTKGEDIYGVQSQSKAFVKKALQGLKKVQGEDGSFGNINSDSMVVIGLIAAGEDPDKFSNNGCSLTSALSLYINDSNDGFITTMGYGIAGEKARNLATEQGFRALVAMERYKELGRTAYNIYLERSDKEVPGEANDKGKVEDEDIVQSNMVNINLKVLDDEGRTWFESGTVKVGGKTNLIKAIEKNLAKENISCEFKGDYLKAITYKGIRLAEFTKGRKSGWVYRYNGKFGKVPLGILKLNEGDSIELIYTDDYSKPIDKDNNSKPRKPKKPSIKMKRPGKVQKLKVKKSGRKYILSWKTVKGAKGYQKQVKGKKKWTDLVRGNRISKTKFRTMKYIKGKKYCYRVRAYRIYKGKKIYGKWSNVVWVKS